MLLLCDGEYLQNAHNGEIGAFYVHWLTFSGAAIERISQLYSWTWNMNNARAGIPVGLGHLKNFCLASGL